MEVFCDESGSDGENLIGGNTDVFAHAGVHLPLGPAADSIQEIRNRIRSPAEEYKANHLLRGKHRSTLEWMLGPSGPIHGNANVHLTDKAFFVVGRLVDLLVGENGRPAGAMALTLYREGPLTFGPEQWQAFLSSSNNLMRTKNRWDARTPVESFFQLVDALRPATAGHRVGDIMELLREARPRADSFWAQTLENPAMIPALDPLIPAVVRTVAYWGEGGEPISLVHDEQNALTEERIAWLKEHLRSPQCRLTSVRLVDSRSDPRVQLADFLAGVARKIASDELNGRGDTELTALLRPYVDASSIWGDDRSWSLLGPARASAAPDKKPRSVETDLGFI
ncbi:DUF3800 domain-containing protein [Streptomyces sp. NPDC005408]|uniref:DUF3800 domain-containing protein n=1 Tax=Streptomyces sp. NPDC005408 TaxID=3155341 RepID=UPI0033A9464C